MEIELGPSSILHPLGKLSVSQELCFLPLDSELKEIFFGIDLSWMCTRHHIDRMGVDRVMWKSMSENNLRTLLDFLRVASSW